MPPAAPMLRGLLHTPSCTPPLIPTCCPQVQIQASFRPGDVVRAEVLSLGDARSYHLTTAKNELGVVYAKSVAGKLQGWWGGGAKAGLVQRIMAGTAACCMPATAYLAHPPDLTRCPTHARRCAHGAHQLAGDAVPPDQGR